MNDWTPATTPGGGGFCTAKYSMAYLYEQFKLGNNIWTTSNCEYDLVRYTGCKFIFYRHPYIDFIIQYQLEYPLTISPDDLQKQHPRNLLLQKHILILPSLRFKPYGKPYKKKKIRPPKQMSNKWFFQHQFADTGLVLIRAAACDLLFSHIGEQSENELTSFICLNTDTVYTHGGWGITQPNHYYPTSTWGPNTDVSFVDKKGTTQNYKLSDYSQTVSYDKGWFSPQYLSAQKWIKPNTTPPYNYVRYNPKIDNGKGNIVYFLSVHNERFDPPGTDKVLITQDKPLWLLLYGWTDYIKKLRKDVDFNKTYYIAMISPALFVSGREPANKPVIPIDDTIFQGKSAYGATPNTWQTTNWFPTFTLQQQTINNIVKAGPFIPKPEGKKSNWELHAKYSFYFKWGGAPDSAKAVCDPAKASFYPGPDPIPTTIQITDPKTQVPESLLHTWDWRRGYITKKAFKRMYEHLQTESTISTDADHSELPPKTKKSKKEPSLQEKETKEEICLQQLFAGDICQEIQEMPEDPIQQLIYQQQQQQQLLKHNLLTLITSMKNTQQQMQLQTGIL